MRLSLGASRRRVIRHLLAESLLLAGLGTGAGLILNFIAVRVVSSMTLPLPVPIHLVMKTDTRLLAYSACIAVGCAIVSGLLPALKAVRKDVNALLKTQERQTGRVWGLRSALVTGQLAVTVVLLAVGFLFVHNLSRATSLDTGFDLNHLLWASMRLAPDRYPSQASEAAVVNSVLDRLRAMPGVEAAAITSNVALNDNCKVGIDVRSDAPGAKASGLEYECADAGPDYFRAMRIPLLSGREFLRQDGGEAVGIVNQAFARAVFGNENAVGRTVYIHDDPPLRIIGVAADSKYFSLGERHLPALFRPYVADLQRPVLNFMIRTLGNPAGLVKSVTATLGELDSTAAIETKPMTQALGFALLPSRAGAAMLGAMGMLGLALASIGLYGVLLYSVSRRTREIGLRVALGATSGQVLRIVVRHSFALIGIGTAAGLALAFLAMQPLAMFLVPGVSPSDPTAFLAVIGVLAIVGLVATLAPALRALRIDPMTALRYE